MKSRKTLNAFLCTSMLSIWSSCYEPDCENYTKTVGVVQLTPYDKGIFNNCYSFNQTIKFLRNNKDTITLLTAGSYFEEEQVELSAIYSMDCGSGYKCNLENHGIQLFSPSKDTIYFLYIQSTYHRASYETFDIKPKDTLSFMNFGATRLGKQRGTIGSITIDPDNLNNDSVTIDQLVINGITFHHVYYYQNTNPFSGIKEIYFHPKYGVIKFTYFKVNPSSIQGDSYEILL